MRISHSLWRKLVVTLVAVSGFVLVYQATILDSRYAARQALLREDKADPGPGTRLRFEATAYCTGEVTASGLPAAHRASRPPTPTSCRPARSSRSRRSAPQYDGVYTIMDTGPAS